MFVSGNNDLAISQSNLDGERPMLSREHQGCTTYPYVRSEERRVGKECA